MAFFTNGSRNQENEGLSDSAEPPQRRLSLHFGLSTKLLLLTTAFVMLAEVLIFVPSVANFRKTWLTERLAAAQIAALAAQASTDEEVPEKLGAQLLDSSMIHSLAVNQDGARRLIMKSPVNGMVDAHYNLETASFFSLIADALYVFASPRDRLILVMGQPQLSESLVEIVLTERPLKQAVYDYAFNIFALSVAISLFTATLVYLSLNWFLVRPVSRLTWNMVDFRANPEDASRVIKPSGRTDEIGMAEDELATMQNELINMLRQKNRLASLGLAVSKINHDLRNLLSSAQLISDRLSSSSDPMVQKFAPKLIASLDRAIALCSETLRYGKAEESPPERHRFLLLPLLEELGESLALPSHGRIAWRIEADPMLEIDADRNQLYRILHNLVRNATQVLEALENEASPEIRIVAEQDGDHMLITVADNGPGVPARAKENLFKAFQGSLRVGGTGLGLAIAAELTRAHGGAIWLEETCIGATFRIKMPNRAHKLANSTDENAQNDAGILAFGRVKH
ncbi:MAG: HAMP domain-containing histidine kinase [Hyphomicrobiales bacterium]|nr:HAMP domain-containing histidine kinase [Hyphomicrobiales bacterium]